MSTVVTISASRSAVSGSDAALSVAGNRIRHSGHAVTTLVLRELPAAPLLAADLTDPDVARAVALVTAADGVVVASPVAPPVVGASAPGLLEVFLRLLPDLALRGKAVLPLLTGSASAQAAAARRALQSVLSSMGGDAPGQACFVLDGHIRAYPDGGAVLDAASALSLAEATEAFLALLSRQAPVIPPRRAPGRVSPEAGAPDLTVVRAAVDDPVVAPLLHDLMIEYSTRYGGPSPYTTLTEVPASDFTPPDGAFVVLTEDSDTIAGGALRRYDEQTAEVKRVWTSSRHRRRGLGIRLMAELERVALELGYRRIHLTTGGRQPEAVALYLAAGYVARFDIAADHADSGPLAFGKELVAGAGLVDWVDQSAAEYYGTKEPTARQPVTASAE